MAAGAAALAVGRSSYHLARMGLETGTQWEQIVALARAVDDDVASHRPVNVDIALRLSEAVLALDQSLEAPSAPSPAAAAEE